MKKTIFIACLALASLNVSVAQIISYQANFYSSLPSSNEASTRVLFHYLDYSLVYMEHMNSPVFIVNSFSAPFSTISPLYNYSYFDVLPQIHVNDMKKKMTQECFGGTYNNEGLYGIIHYPPSGGIFPSSLHLRRLPDMNNLKKIAPVIHFDNNNMILRLFAIGETNKNHILELHIFGYGISDNTPYPFATLDPRETADDITSTLNWLAVATRDTRDSAAPFNLRISKLSQVLGNTDIDYQWQFFLSNQERPVGKVLLARLQDDDIEMCYIKHNAIENSYLLCLHRIRVPDLTIGNGVLGTQEVKVNPNEVLEDVMYDTVTGTLVVLTNTDNQYSTFYHIRPSATSSYLAIKLQSNIGDKYYSLNPVNEYWWTAGHSMYQAWGGSRYFTQEIDNMGTVAGSCLNIDKVTPVIKSPESIPNRFVKLERQEGTRTMVPNELDQYWLQGFLDCNK